ncbi:GDSL-like lipase/acylhydrolase family protein [Streptomyces sp. 1114.5]|uniref:GDSL-type esterase/lipase family protein n=1 Tax=Streptomyces sp. 1114.5 TaxID=1938830 RepID=UPI000F2526A4|nr:GDSL-type esterase/lipase family protein [Streptomyces sp. 1114.5]RKT19823.1 GDSL-like lipase/acylhydrolase family protein [Streptomyces sp. 1114.5]
MRILVLGDSSSAGIGAPQVVHPGLLAERLRGRHRIENHAIPGFTSADAARYYLRTLSRQRWDVLIVYLGNNEAARSARYKGAYHRRRDLFRRAPERPVPQPVVRIRPREQLVLAEEETAPAIATTVRDFRRNLEAITDRARQRGTRVILVNPVANERFPPGLMGAHAPFTRIVGLDWRVADLATGSGPEARELLAALGAHERGDLDTAGRRYRKAATTGSFVRPIALNNLAVLLDRRGAAAEAAEILRRTAQERTPLGAIAAYNLSRILARRGDHREAGHYAHLALEGDTNLYRVKSAYREQTAALAADPNVDVLDLAELLKPADFVDYCHPTAAGHQVIATALATRLAPYDTGEEPDAGYVCVHPNPDAFFDLGPGVADYYRMGFDVDPQQVRSTAGELLRRARELGGDPVAGTGTWPVPDSDLQAQVLDTLRHAARHPLIASLADLERMPPAHGSEIGSFPEFYVSRLLCEFAAAAESSGTDGLPEEAAAAWPLDSEVHRQRILWRGPAGLPGLLGAPGSPGEPATDRAYGRRILAKVRARLADHTGLFADTRADRIATIRYWYLREAFRYGTHSRPSMLYPATDLDALAEGLYTAVLIARTHRDAQGEAGALALLTGLTRLREVHERHAVALVEAEFTVTGAAGADYAAELAGLRASLTAGG